MDWDPGVYEGFRDARARPLRDLVAQVPRAAVRTVIDAGCGTGRTTHTLASRFRQADLLGIDASGRMIALAQSAPRVRFQQADLLAFEPDAPVDLVVANAVLHWMPDPEAAFARLAAWAGDGIVAVQVPANFDQPSHTIARRVAAQHGLPPSPAKDIPLADPVRWLPDHEVDAWETTYLHFLPGPDAVLRWLSGTTLRPYLGRGRDADQALLQALREPLAEAYPARDGVTAFPFTRRFWVARAAT